MDLSLLTAISPIDGRYRGKTEPLADYFSEYALIRYRVRVEIEYFIALCELPLPQLSDFNHDLFDELRKIYLDFTPADAQRVKDIEAITNHDVKAVEYFIKEALDGVRGSKKELDVNTPTSDTLISKVSTSNSLSEAVTSSNSPLIPSIGYRGQVAPAATMQGTDVLFPQIGEIIGGSVREESYDKLMAEINKRGMETDKLWWYLDTRRWGSCPHAGFGLGFERLILFVTGMQNIRDVIPFPRTPKSAEF